jgi:hypothetical protein
LLVELLSVDFIEETPRPLLKELNSVVVENTDQTTANNEEDESSDETEAIEKNKKRMEANILNSALKRSCSLDSLDVKSNVLWQLGRCSENLSKNFSVFVKSYRNFSETVRIFFENF